MGRGDVMCAGWGLYWSATVLLGQPGNVQPIHGRRVKTHEQRRLRRRPRAATQHKQRPGRRGSKSFQILSAPSFLPLHTLNAIFSERQIICDIFRLRVRTRTSPPLCDLAAMEGDGKATDCSISAAEFRKQCVEFLDSVLSDIKSFGDAVNILDDAISRPSTSDQQRRSTLRRAA